MDNLPIDSEAIKEGAKYAVPTATCAAAGAAIGTIVCPGLGSAIGAGVGGIVGGTATIIKAVKEKR